MKAVIINNDHSLSWSDVPDPVCGKNQVVVEIHAVAVNRADIMQKEGNYPPPPGWPEWPGLEISGIITELSDEVGILSGFKIGDRVCALLGGGGYAEYAVVPWDMLMPIPEGLSMQEAAALPEAFATAYLNLFLEGGAKPGDTLLMHAGASGLASVIIPLAKAFGIRVITSVLNDEKAKKIAHLNADIVVDTSVQDIVQVLKQEESLGRPVNIVIDCLGGQKTGECFKYVAYGCRWIIISTLAGEISSVNLRVLLLRNVRLIGSTLRSKPQAVKVQILNRLVREIWPKIESGEVRPTIYKTVPIFDAEIAHSFLERGENVGKVVLLVK